MADSKTHILAKCEVSSGAASGDFIEIDIQAFSGFDAANEKMRRHFLKSLGVSSVAKLKAEYPDADWSSDDGYLGFLDTEADICLERDSATIPVDSEIADPLTLKIFGIGEKEGDTMADSKKYVLIQCEVFTGAVSGDFIEPHAWFYKDFDSAYKEMLQMFLKAIDIADMADLKSKYPHADWGKDGDYDTFYDEDTGYCLDRDSAIIDLDHEYPAPMTLKIFEI